MQKNRLTEAQAERLADHTVQRRLATDSAYQHAESAEVQAERAAAIEAEVWADLEYRFEIA